MSHLVVPDESDRLTNEFPSRSMSRSENIIFEEKLNSRICDCSPSSSVISGGSDISDIPPPPPLEDDDDADAISHCSYISNSILHLASNRIDTVESIRSGICRSSATAVTNQKPDVAHSGCHDSNDDNSNPCSVKWENGNRIQARALTCGSDEVECSNTNNQIAVACEDDDDEIDMNFDLSTGASEYEDCRKAKDSTCCGSKCNNSATGGRVDHKAIDGFDFWDIRDKIIAASCAGWRHEDSSIAIFENVQDSDDDVSSLIGLSIPRLENSRHWSDDSSLSLRSVRSNHQNQSRLGTARVDPPALNEDGDAPSASLFPVDHRSDINRALCDCFLILKVFALRCTFDHWRRKTKFEEQSSSSLFEPLSFDECGDFDMLSLLSSNSNVSPSILSPDAYSVASVRNVRLCPMSSLFHVSRSILSQFQHWYHALTFNGRNLTCIRGRNKSNLTRLLTMFLSG